MLYKIEFIMTRLVFCFKDEDTPKGSVLLSAIPVLISNQQVVYDLKNVQQITWNIKGLGKRKIFFKVLTIK